MNVLKMTVQGFRFFMVLRDRKTLREPRFPQKQLCFVKFFSLFLLYYNETYYERQLQSNVIPMLKASNSLTYGFDASVQSSRKDDKAEETAKSNQLHILSVGLFPSGRKLQ